MRSEKKFNELYRSISTEITKEMLKDVKRADSLSGARGDSFFKQSAARGMQGAGENGGGTGMAFMGMGMNAVGNAMGQMNVGNEQYSNPNLSFNQPQNQNNNWQGNNNAPQAPAQEPAPAAAASTEDPYEKLAKLKKLLEQGVISQEEFDEAKKKLLDL